MRKHLKRMVTVVGVMSLSAILFVQNALATAAYPLTGVEDGIVDQIQEAVTTALPIAGPIIALFIGWRVFKRLVRG